jgi:hypothetical protein
LTKSNIKIHFQNGLTLENFKKDVFDIEGLSTEYDFEESANPDFIVFGPYGNDIPPKGDYVRVGYFCENIKPDLSICEWAFGVPREEYIGHPKYKRIQWHSTDPLNLVKPAGYDAEKILSSKTKFCNFLYSHQVPYREAFFKQLSKYKKVDAPGKSMNNMAGIDSLYQGTRWEVKRKFLADYKFTIAFENDVFPGYQTEKLYDAMQAQSIPLYYGDALVGELFDTNSFINVPDYVPGKKKALTGKLQRLGQMDFEDIRPSHIKTAKSRVKRKTKSLVRDLNTQLRFANMDFGPVIEKIIELDTKPELYLQYLEKPWLHNNTVPKSSYAKSRWIEIFNSR